MALRIEIARMYNNKLELRIGDLTGASTSSNFTKEEVLSDISDEIDTLLEDNTEINNREHGEIEKCI